MQEKIQFPSGFVQMHYASEPFDWSNFDILTGHYETTQRHAPLSFGESQSRVLSGSRGEANSVPVTLSFGESQSRVLSGSLGEAQNRTHKILITNEHIARLYPTLFANKKTLVIPAGEHSKDIGTIAHLTNELLKMEATRKTTLIGIGGGVITDITGFLASIYMRGIPFGFVPTSLLGMVDASIGGKNGVNVNLYKNILGVFHHPEFIVFDIAFLKTLPNPEWSNGFAEIIKYAICFDADFFTELSQKYLSFYKEDTEALSDVIKKCVAIKCRVVAGDEHESGERKLLNFGHTVGHAIENLYELSHGNAIAIGMQIACRISEKVCGLNPEVTEKLLKVLRQYYLPISQPIASNKVMDILKMDKKRSGDSINFILLEATGKAVIKPLSFDIIEQALVEYERNN